MIRSSFLVLVSCAVAALGCSSSSSSSSDTAAGADAAAAGDAGPAADAGADAATAAGDGGVANVRGQRYCELLLAQVTNGQVHVDVYNTFGLNDCPEAQWSMIDAAALAKQLGVTQVLVNGPRYWMIDEFVVGGFIDPTPRTLGGIPMRHAGSIDFPVSAASMLSTPYALHSIQRNTVVRFEAGKPVYELVDPQGKIYEMQSYSVQKTPQTESDLANLGSKLSLPSGWSFRTRVLTANLDVTAVGGIGTVTQDDFDNTYQQSQQ